jgi:hypothetical protein
MAPTRRAYSAVCSLRPPHRLQGRLKQAAAVTASVIFPTHELTALQVGLCSGLQCAGLHEHVQQLWGVASKESLQE